MYLCVYISNVFNLVVEDAFEQQSKTNGNPEAEMKKICFHLHILALVND